ncbi:hypothetical protein [Methylicorpusculum sp.]|nr:hypothetical protein [Methylicorpusculum sp.]
MTGASYQTNETPISADRIYSVLSAQPVGLEPSLTSHSDGLDWPV